LDKTKDSLFPAHQLTVFGRGAEKRKDEGEDEDEDE